MKGRIIKAKVDAPSLKKPKPKPKHNDNLDFETVTTKRAWLPKEEKEAGKQSLRKDSDDSSSGSRSDVEPYLLPQEEPQVKTLEKAGDVAKAKIEEKKKAI